MVNFEEIQNHFNIKWIECNDDDKLSKYEEWFHILEKQCDLTYHSPDGRYYMKVEWISEYIKFYIYYQMKKFGENQLVFILVLVF